MVHPADHSPCIEIVLGRGLPQGRTKHRVDLRASDSLKQLGMAIATTTGIAPDDQVIVFKVSEANTDAVGLSVIA